MAWYHFVKWFVRTVFFGLMGGVNSVGRENVPPKGRLIVASVHISHIDPPLIGSVFPRTLRFMAKQELFKFPLGILLRSLLAFPVKRGE
ncbi:MAG: 1-acyl-sn-glycerol-3-phosphate acyltransferase, partial [Fimbriimonadaceae bacterium]|nr:1-acyl-sn-glycerol-3-phosphate acyltransferase [Fimbriimonadaceae bacterium]